MVKKKKKPLHAVTQYARDIKAGKISANRWTRLACIRHLQDLNTGKKRGLYFDETAADHIIDFFPMFLKFYEGAFDGQPFYLTPNQQFIVGSIFGWKRKVDKCRRFRTVYCEMGKGQGKTPLAAGIGLYGLTFDDEPGGEIYAAAALALDTPVPIPSGWSNIGNIKVGDVLFDDTGKKCNVTYVTDAMLKHDCYRMEFDGASPIIADGGHLWETIDKWSGNGSKGSRRVPVLRCESGRKAVFCLHNQKYYVCKWSDPKREQKFKIMLQNELKKSPIKNYRAKKNIRATLEIMQNLYVPEYWNKGKRSANHKIPIAKAINLPDISLPIPPYILGVWLGDGRSNGGQLVCHPSDIEIIDHIKSHGFDVTIMPFDKKLTHFTITGLRTLLRENQLLNNKHIPKIYMRASIKQRSELLQGLLDTDGCATKTGECTFSNINKRIAYGLYEIVQSLGIKAHISKRPPSKLSLKDGYKRQPFYHISFRAYADNPVFCMKRKRNRQRTKPKIALQNDFHYIKNITPIGSVPVKCIEVDSPSHLFLAGKDFIPTHNTTKEQAGILFRDARLYAEASEALKEILIIDKYNIANPGLNSFFRSISSEHRGLDGKRPHMALIDEIHEHRDDLVVRKMSAGMKGRREGLQFEITNSGYDRHSICFQHHEYTEKILEGTIEDDAWFGIMTGLDVCKKCEADGKTIPQDGCPDCDDWRDEAVWEKANPNLNYLGAPFKDYLRRQVEEAKAMPSQENIVKRLNFCIWTESISKWIPTDKWNACAFVVDPEKLKGRTAYGGLDLSTNIDLTAWVLVFPPEEEEGKYEVLCRFFLPEDNMRERVSKDKVPYDVWVRQGFITTTPGDLIDYAFILDQIDQDSKDFDIAELAFDRWGSSKITTDLQDLGFELEGKKSLIQFGQGYRSMSPAISDVETMVLGCNMAHGGNPVLNWMISNVAIKIDPAGNKKPDKEKSTERIDGAVALLMASARAMLKGGPIKSVYDGMDSKQISNRMAM